MEVLSLDLLRPPLRTSVARSPPRSPSSTPFVSAPASPSNTYSLILSRSAPSSPPRRDREDLDHSSDLRSAVPFNWEESPGTPKCTLKKHQYSMELNFKFASTFPFHEEEISIKNSVDHLREMGFTYFSAPTSPSGTALFALTDRNLDKPEEEEEDGNDSFEFASKLSEDDSVISAPMSTADELFCNGKILPLKLPPRLQNSYSTPLEDVRSSTQYGTSESIQNPTASHEFWDGRKCCESSRSDSNAENINSFLGVNTSTFTKGSYRKEEWTKKLSPFRYFRAGDKSRNNIASSKAPPYLQQTKPESSGGSKRPNISNNRSDRKDNLPPRKSVDYSTLKNLLHFQIHDSSQCSKAALNLGAADVPSGKWYDKSNNRRLENGAERSWPRSSGKTILQTRSARASPVTPSSFTPSPVAATSMNKQHHKNNKQQQQQRGSRGSSGVSQHERCYRLYQTSTEQTRKATFLPYRRGLLGCFSFTHFKRFEISSRLDRVVK